MLSSPALYPTCPVRGVLSRISTKWAMLVLHALELKAPRRFSDLQREMQDASSKMLSQTLRTLEEDGIVTRTVYPEVPPRVEYDLTLRGHSLLTCLDPLLSWAATNMTDILRDRAAATQVKAS